MIEQLYLASVEEPSAHVIERRAIQESEIGLMHSKQAFRYEVVKILPQEAETFKKAFDYAKPFGNFRFAWIDTDNIQDNIVTTATALGGSFGFNSASFYGLSIHVGAYTSQMIPFLNPSKISLNGDYFDQDGDSFTYLAESSIDYKDENIFARIGRIKIDTPYAQSDDIRMAANTFEGMWLEYSINENISMQTYYLSRWAGYDSGEAQDTFKALFKNEQNKESWGSIGASVAYSFHYDDEVSLWYYHVDAMSDIFYAEVAGHIDISESNHIEYGIQAAHIQEREDSSIGGDVIGTMVIVDYDDFFFGFSGNYAFVEGDNSITNGFGGGPYYTSLDESTIGYISEISQGKDVFSTRIGIGTSLGFIGIDDLTLEFVHGQLQAIDKSEWIKENDIAFTYEHDKRIVLSGVFANFDVIESQSVADEDFNRFIVRADYSF